VVCAVTDDPDQARASLYAFVTVTIFVALIFIAGIAAFCGFVWWLLF
jgi:hypothetical protein